MFEPIEQPIYEVGHLSNSQGYFGIVVLDVMNSDPGFYLSIIRYVHVLNIGTRKAERGVHVVVQHRVVIQKRCGIARVDRLDLMVDQHDVFPSHDRGTDAIVAVAMVERP